ncbi:MAG: hypothetical protein QG608_713 [Actinomycetota bacterium]|nr:hypothetical protein [Actinomycetota bacterium]
MPDQQPPTGPQGSQPGAGDDPWQNPGDQGLFANQGAQPGSSPAGGTESVDTATMVTAPTPSGGPGRTALIAGGAAAAVLLVGGGVYAYSVSGNETSEDLDCYIPASAAFFLEVDADPSAGQKLDAFKIARKFPTLGAPTDHEDLRRWLVEAAGGNQGAAGEEWKEVEKWIGDRVAVAVMPGGSGSATAVPLIVLQTEDEGAAESFLKKSSAKQQTQSGSPLDYVVSEGWAYVRPGEETGTKTQTLLDEAKRSSLFDSKTYQEDMKTVGEKGILTGWVDVGKVAPLLETANEQSGNLESRAQMKALMGQGIAGHGAWALRFDGDAVEVTGEMRDVSPKTEQQGEAGVAKLPDDTLLAFGATGMGKTVAGAWQQALQASGGQDPTQMLAQFEKVYGLSLPDDLEALLGTSFTLAVGGSGTVAAPEVGAKVMTEASDTAGPLQALSKLMTQAGMPLQHSTTKGGYTIATTSGYAKKLGTDGNLASTDRFKKAVPKADGAGTVLYADVAGILEKYGTALTQGVPVPPELSKIDAIGMSSTVKDNGDSSFSLRLTTR